MTDLSDEIAQRTEYDRKLAAVVNATACWNEAIEAAAMISASYARDPRMQEYSIVGNDIAGMIRALKRPAPVPDEPIARLREQQRKEVMPNTTDQSIGLPSAIRLRGEANKTKPLSAQPWPDRGLLTQRVYRILDHNHSATASAAELAEQIATGVMELYPHTPTSAEIAEVRAERDELRRKLVASAVMVDVVVLIKECQERAHGFRAVAERRLRMVDNEGMVEAVAMADCFSNAATALTALAADNVRLKAALKPFAASAHRYETCRDDRPLIHTWNDSESLTVGDLRKARAALEGKA